MLHTSSFEEQHTCLGTIH